MITEMLIIAAGIIVVFGSGMVVGIIITEQERPGRWSGRHIKQEEDEQ